MKYSGQGNYYVNYQNYQNLMLLTSSDTKRTLMHLLLFTNSAQGELVSICTQSIHNRNWLSLPYILGVILKKKNTNIQWTKSMLQFTISLMISLPQTLKTWDLMTTFYWLPLLHDLLLEACLWSLLTLKLNIMKN